MCLCCHIEETSPPHSHKKLQIIELMRDLHVEYIRIPLAVLLIKRQNLKTELPAVTNRCDAVPARGLALNRLPKQRHYKEDDIVTQLIINTEASDM